MIHYDIEPLPLAAVSEVENWRASRAATLFLECVRARMSQFYIEGLRLRSRAGASETSSDHEKFKIQSESKMAEADRLFMFLKIWEEFPKEPLHKIKVIV